MNKEVANVIELLLRLRMRKAAGWLASLAIKFIRKPNNFFLGHGILTIKKSTQRLQVWMGRGSLILLVRSEL